MSTAREEFHAIITGALDDMGAWEHAVDSGAAADAVLDRLEIVDEGWWHPNTRGGTVHDHAARNPQTMHRLCTPVYTIRGRRP